MMIAAQESRARGRPKAKALGYQPLVIWRILRRLKEGAEKVSRKTKNVPQRLKPRCEQSTFGTAEAVPLSKTTFSAPS
jgi:hypothetical protein